MIVERWKCSSYCLCKTAKGHFEKSDEGVWVLYEEAQALERENKRLRKENAQLRDVIDSRDRTLGFEPKPDVSEPAEQK